MQSAAAASESDASRPSSAGSPPRRGAGRTHHDHRLLARHRERGVAGRVAARGGRARALGRRLARSLSFLLLRPAARPPGAGGHGARRGRCPVGLLPALAGLGLTLLGAAFAVWAAQRADSAWLAFWCFFLVQAFHVSIPASLTRGNSHDAPDDAFARAHRAAEAAMRRLSSSTR